MDLAEFEALNSLGETQTFERKVEGQWRDGLKSLCGMVNAIGTPGFVALGVSPDGTVQGVTGDTDVGCPRFHGGGFLESRRPPFVVPSFKLDGGKHAKRRVSTLAIVKDLQVLEDRIGQLDPGLPTFSIE